MITKTLQQAGEEVREKFHGKYGVHTVAVGAYEVKVFVEPGKKSEFMEICQQVVWAAAPFPLRVRYVEAPKGEENA